jgi:GrpB-like predicted nucleotidyltransferase (UPF0157 family)
MLGIKYGVVDIIPYQSLWAQQFECERKLLLPVLGTEVIRIEHVGSTAISGLDAKPTLDMLAGLKELKSAEWYAASLRDVGYEFRPRHPVPGRLHFAKIQDGLRTHNLSLTVYGSDFWEAHLLFRDYLRSHPEAAQAYQALKHRLAEKYPGDTVQYTAGKDEFIAETLKAALAWRAGREVSVRTAST